MEKSKLAILAVALPLLAAGCLGFGASQGNPTEDSTLTVPANATSSPTQTSTTAEPFTETSVSGEPATETTGSTDSGTDTSAPAEPPTETTTTEPATETTAPTDSVTETSAPAEPPTETSTPTGPPTETTTTTEPATETNTPTDSTETSTPTETDQNTETESPSPTPDSSVEQVLPSEEVTVVPGSTLMFEYESDDWYRTEWYVDGESVGSSLGEVPYTYHEDQNAVYRFETFESEGTYEVSANVYVDDDSNETLNWTVHVDESGHEQPSVDALRPDGPIEYVIGEEIELGVDVSDADADLDRVLWWEFQRDIIVGEDDVDGASASSNISTECNGCTPAVWVIDEQGIVTREGWGDLDYAEVLNVDIVGTNEPIDRGDTLEVIAEIQNSGSVAHEQEFELEVKDGGGEFWSGEPVDTANVTIPPGETETITLTYDTTGTSGDNITLRVGPSHNRQGAEATVEIGGGSDP